MGGLTQSQYGESVLGYFGTIGHCLRPNYAVLKRAGNRLINLYWCSLSLCNISRGAARSVLMNQQFQNRYDVVPVRVGACVRESLPSSPLPLVFWEGSEGGRVGERRCLQAEFGQRLNPADDRTCVAYSPRLVYVFGTALILLCSAFPQFVSGLRSPATSARILEPACALSGLSACQGCPKKIIFEFDVAQYLILFLL